MKNLFRGYIVKVYTETDFSSNKYLNYNKELIQLCINYYIQCWKKQNEILYNPVKLRNRSVIQYNNKRELAINGAKPQVKKYIIRNEIEVQQSSTEYIRQLVRGLKEMKRRSEVLKGDNIRTYFIQNIKNIKDSDLL